MDAHSNDAETLLADTRWMRSLARGLLGDATAAEDVAQDAWRSVHERRELLERSRGTLGGLVRTFARRFRRAEARLHARERRVARDEAVPSTDELVERLELQRIVAEELAELREPLRTTLLLRYHAGLDAAEIAQRVGVEHAAVRKRIERGLAELRERLDARCRGGRDAWCALLAPLARTDSVALTSSLLLSVVLVFVVVLAGVAITWGWNSRIEGDAVVRSTERAPAASNARQSRARRVEDPPAERSSELFRSESAIVAPTTTSTTTEHAEPLAVLSSSTEVAVLVVGPDAARVSGARVELHRGTRAAPPAPDARALDAATTDANGRVMLRATPTWSELTLTARRDDVGTSGLVGLAGSGVRPGAQVEPVLVPSAQVVVEVRDASNAPLPSEHVSLRQHGIVFGGPNPRPVPDVKTDAHGRAVFEVDGVRATWNASVTTSTGDSDAVEFTTPLASTTPIPLRPKTALVIEGRVHGIGSSSIADQVVTAWTANDAHAFASTRTTEDGAFELRVERSHEWLVAAGTSAGFVRAPELVHFAEDQRRARIELRFVAPSSSSGRVRWEDGRPAKGALVSACAASATSPDPRAAMLERFGLDLRETRTDGEGRFTLDGLHPDLVYVVAAGDDEREPRRFVAREGVVPGTSDLELVFSERALRKGWVRGHVVDATTRSALSAFELELYERNAEGVWWPLNLRPRIDPSGMFELQGLVPGREYALSACFLEHVLRTHPSKFVADDEHGTELELAVSPAAELIVEVRGQTVGEPRPELVVRATTVPVVLASVPVDARHATTRVPGLPTGRVRIELRIGTTTLDAVELDLHAGSNLGASLDAVR